jgi:two-component system, LuxR family, sensor histidine kinase DctS
MPPNTDGDAPFLASIRAIQLSCAAGDEEIRRTGGDQLKPADSTEPTWSIEPTGARRRRFDLLSLVPLVSIVALVGLVATLVVVVLQGETDRLRVKLATDALWVEQTLRFQMSMDEDMLVRLGLDSASGVPLDTVAARARLHLANNPEVLAIEWRDGGGDLLLAVPPRRSSGITIAEAGPPSPIPSRSTYGPVGANGTVAMSVGAADGGGRLSFLISLPLLLERHIPWWIAEQYSIELLDSGGQEVAARARRDAQPAAPSHTISFDPPLHGVVLRIAAYEAPAGPANLLLLAAIAALAVFAIVALLVLARNAAQRRRAEDRLLAEMAFRRAMEESLTVGLRAKDQQGRILYVNSAFCQLVGFPAEQLIGHVAPMPYWAPERLEETLARQAALAAGGAVAQSFETRFRRADGTEIDVQVYEAPLIDASGVHRGWMGSVIDITEARRAARLARTQEDNLARTGRLVTLGEMASTLAHELNQPLSAIASYAAGARNLLDGGRLEPGVLAPVLDKLALQASRAGEIIRRIQDFVRKREPRLEAISLADVVTETVGFLAADARENRVRIVTELSLSPPVLADRILIEQVLINLMRNGMEAMADNPGGDLTVTVVPEAPDRVLVEVADRGSGIAEEVSGRLYDAFTSTKTQGLGMGLNICRSIVELHRGRLTHAPRPGGGTVFRILLPEAAANRAAAE